ncbi:TPA: Tn7 transposase TnsA N-terminal domain-containing protein [Burkholderia cenocepacia]
MSGVRKVVTRSPFRRVGTVACPWFRSAPIEYESLLERDFIRLALLSLKVSAIFEQPFTLDLGGAGRYTPDFLLAHEHGPIVVEVKPNARVSEPEVRSRLDAAAKILAGRDHRFLVATEDFIRGDKRHDRAAIILRQARSHLQSNVTSKVLVIASRRPDGITIRHLADEGGVPQSTVLHLVGRRQLRIGESLRIDEHQPVFPVEVIR